MLKVSPYSCLSMGLVTKWRDFVELKFYLLRKNFIWPRKVCNAITFFPSFDISEILYFGSTSHLLQYTQFLKKFYKTVFVEQISRNISKT